MPFDLGGEVSPNLCIVSPMPFDLGGEVSPNLCIVSPMPFKPRQALGDAFRR